MLSCVYDKYKVLGCGFCIKALALIAQGILNFQHKIKKINTKTLLI